MSEADLLRQLCERLGAPREQAATMARQLLKRAEQLAVDRGWTRDQALAYLVRLVVEGRGGGVPGEFKPPAPDQKSTDRPAK